MWLAAAGLAAVAALGIITSRGGETGAQAPQAAGGFVGGDLHSLVADPTTPGRLFVGGHEAVSVSNDGGRTWSRTDSLNGADAMGWGFTDEVVWVSGHPGVNRSSDDGATFARANEGLPNTDVHAFGAGVSVIYGAGPAVGVIASTDGGRTWQPRTGEAGQAFFGRMLVDGADDQHLVAADAQSGAVESTDGGRTWRRLGGPPSALWVSRHGEALFVSGPQGAAQSADGGRTWDEVALPAGASILEADPTTTDLLFTAVHTGDRAEILFSRDGGQTWSRSEAHPVR